MAVDVARAGEPGTPDGWVARSIAWVQHLPAGYRSVMAELRRVTWPDAASVKNMSLAVIALSLAIGAVIALMDVTLQQVLVKWIPQIFSGR